MTWTQRVCEGETLEQTTTEKCESQGEREEGKWEDAVSQEPEMRRNSEENEFAEPIRHIYIQLEVYLF